MSDPNFDDETFRTLFNICSDGAEHMSLEPHSLQRLWAAAGLEGEQQGKLEAAFRSLDVGNTGKLEYDDFVVGCAP